MKEQRMPHHSSFRGAAEARPNSRRPVRACPRRPAKRNSRERYIKLRGVAEASANARRASWRAPAEARGAAEEQP